MKNFFAVVAATLVVFLLLTSRAQAYEVVDSNTIRLHVLSYNIKGLPAIINPDWDQDRFKDIGDLLSARRANANAPDVVFLQESFGERTLELQKAAGYKFAAQGPSNSKVVSSGLYILSNFPIDYSQGILYGNFECGTWDCFAAKGAMAARIQLPGVPFEITVATTHAQSGGTWNDARKTQLQEFADFLASLINPDNGLIVGGDFNTRPSRPSYQDFVRKTGFSSVGEVCLAPANGCALLGHTDPANLLNDSNDQFFFQSGKRVTIRPISVERNFGEPVKGRLLSDHLGYETVFEISWK